jgi:hypothetical protein
LRSASWQAGALSKSKRLQENLTAVGDNTLVARPTRTSKKSGWFSSSSRPSHCEPILSLLETVNVAPGVVEVVVSIGVVVIVIISVVVNMCVVVIINVVVITGVVVIIGLVS